MPFIVSLLLTCLQAFEEASACTKYMWSIKNNYFFLLQQSRVNLTLIPRGWSKESDNTTVVFIC